MSPETENFEQLRKLLALKRHEQPPPGYFNNFSDRVVARIEIAQKHDARFGWVRRFWSLMEAKPALTGAFGAAACALVIGGIVFSDDTASEAGALHGGFGGINLSQVSADPSSSLVPLHAAAQFASSTNPVSPELNSLLNGVLPMSSQRASSPAFLLPPPANK